MTDLSKRMESEPLLSSSNYSLTEDENYLPNNKDTYDRQRSYDSFPSLDANGSVNTSEKGDTPKPEEYRTYISRWYILILFSLVAFTQSGTWNTWGPIADTSKCCITKVQLVSNYGVCAPKLPKMTEVLSACICQNTTMKFRF